MKTNTKRVYPLALVLPPLLLLGALVTSAVCGQSNGEQSGNANRIVVHLSNPAQPAQINLHMLSGSINVHGYNGNEVTIAGTALRENDVPEEARGMRRLSRAAGLGAEEENNVVTIHTGLTAGNVDVQVPSGSALSLKVTNGNIQVQGISGDLDVESTNGTIVLEQVGGSIVAHALNGRVTANVMRLDGTKPSSFSTLNGRIDVTLPSDLHANLNMRSDQGEIYFDEGFDFKPLSAASSSGKKSESEGMFKLKMGNTIRGAINGGGVEINIRSFNGSILVHKRK